MAQSAIGSGLGFLLGLIAFHYQQIRQLAKKEKDEWRAALDALNRLTNTAVANIEGLTNAKLQFINGLKPEVERMKTASEEIRATPVVEREKKVPVLLSLISTMRYFYLNNPRNFIMQPPEISEYSPLSKDMPSLALFVHRAMGMMQEINERIDSRNALLAELARENGVRTERILYYSSMLSDEGNAICEHTDFALNFWRLVLDQIQAYMSVKGTGEHVLKYELIPKAAEAMPKEELFPLMREQLTTFADDDA